MERLAYPLPINPNAKYLSNSISNVLYCINKFDKSTLAWPTCPKKTKVWNRKRLQPPPEVPLAGTASCVIPKRGCSISRSSARADKKNTFYQILRASQDQPHYEECCRYKRKNKDAQFERNIKNDSTYDDIYDIVKTHHPYKNQTEYKKHPDRHKSLNEQPHMKEILYNRAYATEKEGTHLQYKKKPEHEQYPVWKVYQIRPSVTKSTEYQQNSKGTTHKSPAKSKPKGIYSLRERTNELSMSKSNLHLPYKQGEHQVKKTSNLRQGSGKRKESSKNQTQRFRKSTNDENLIKKKTKKITKTSIQQENFKKSSETKPNFSTTQNPVTNKQTVPEAPINSREETDNKDGKLNSESLSTAVKNQERSRRNSDEQRKSDVDRGKISPRKLSLRFKSFTNENDSKIFIVRGRNSAGKPNMSFVDRRPIKEIYKIQEISNTSHKNEENIEREIDKADPYIQGKSNWSTNQQEPITKKFENDLVQKTPIKQIYKARERPQNLKNNQGSFKGEIDLKATNPMPDSIIVKDFSNQVHKLRKGSNNHINSNAKLNRKSINTKHPKKEIQIYQEKSEKPNNTAGKVKTRVPIGKHLSKNIHRAQKISKTSSSQQLNYKEKKEKIYDKPNNRTPIKKPKELVTQLKTLITEPGPVPKIYFVSARNSKDEPDSLNPGSLPIKTPAKEINQVQGRSSEVTEQKGNDDQEPERAAPALQNSSNESKNQQKNDKEKPPKTLNIIKNEKQGKIEEVSNQTSTVFMSKYFNILNRPIKEDNKNPLGANKNSELQENVKDHLASNKDTELQDNLKNPLVFNKDSELKESLQNPVIDNKDSELQESLQNPLVFNEDSELQESLQSPVVFNENSDLQEPLQNSSIINNDSELQITLHNQFIINKDRDQQKDLQIELLIKKIRKEHENLKNQPIPNKGSERQKLFQILNKNNEFQEKLRNQLLVYKNHDQRKTPQNKLLVNIEGELQYKPEEERRKSDIESKSKTISTPASQNKMRKKSFSKAVDKSTSSNKDSGKQLNMNFFPATESPPNSIKKDDTSITSVFLHEEPSLVEDLVTIRTDNIFLGGRKSIDRKNFNERFNLARKASEVLCMTSEMYNEKLRKCKQYLNRIDVGDLNKTDSSSVDFEGIQDRDLLLYPYTQIYQKNCDIRKENQANVSKIIKKSPKPTTELNKELVKSGEELEQKTACIMCRTIKRNHVEKEAPFLEEMRKEQRRRELLAYRAYFLSHDKCGRGLLPFVPDKTDLSRPLSLHDLSKKLLYSLESKRIIFTNEKNSSNSAPKSDLITFPGKSKSVTLLMKGNCITFLKKCN
ncbi:MATH and LRR domain-containing protein PFE0570w [Drosophila elegans]|uniref:MATH and LRR domain-containing protein PFE0570w n=1 Tax=Drosophila elegans TaxID=30023 RepID=UPI001BC85733|nr:MATH and LRR domain-containing protein PFE0570w [Drosophila elegans]